MSDLFDEMDLDLDLDLDMEAVSFNDEDNQDLSQSMMQDVQQMSFYSNAEYTVSSVGLPLNKKKDFKIYITDNQDTARTFHSENGSEEAFEEGTYLWLLPYGIPITNNELLMNFMLKNESVEECKISPLKAIEMVSNNKFEYTFLKEHLTCIKS